MPDQFNWPQLVSTFRRRIGLTQDGFARKLGVSHAAVSRWESGKNLPDLRTQILIHQDLRSMQLQSKEEWIFRVASSYGHEILFDHKESILSVSDVLVTFHQTSREQIVGSTLTDFFRGFFSTDASVVHATTRDQLSSAFFSGGIRVIHQISDVRVPTGVVRFSSDFWPVVTSDDEILALVVASLIGSSPEPHLCKNYRLVSSTPILHADNTAKDFLEPPR